MKHIRLFLWIVIGWILLILSLGFCKFFYDSSFNYIMVIFFILIIDHIISFFRAYWWIERYQSHFLIVITYVLKIIFLIGVSVAISYLDLEKIYSVSIIYGIYWMVIVMILTIRQPAFKLIFYTPDDKEVKHISKLNLNKPIVFSICASQNKKCRYLGITTLENIKTRKNFLINHIYDTSCYQKCITDLSKVTFIREKERIYLNFPRLKKLFNNKEIVLIIGERKSKKNEKFYYYRLEKFKFNFIKKYRSFIKIIIIPLLVANGLSAIIYGVFRYFHKYITFWLNKNGLIHFLEKFSDKSYKNELINSLTIGIIFLYLTITICIYVLPFWINKFDEFVRKLLIVEAIGVNLLTAVIILSGLADKSINKYVCFFLLVTWIVFNMIEVIIWVYRWMLEDKNTNGIPRTQLIITIIFGILSFVVGKLWR